MLEYALKEDIALNKAIILVAGMGTRLKPRTDTIHKCLTKVNDIPIIENALTCLKSVGVTEVMLVVGYLRDEIKDEIGNEFNGIKIGYVENSDYATTSTSYSLKLGLEAIKDYDTLYVLEGDVFFEKKLIKLIQNDVHENKTLVEKYNSLLDGSFVELKSDGFVKDWTHKSMREEGYVLEDKFKTVNIHCFSAEFAKNKLIPAVIQISDQSHGQEPIENVMRKIVREDNNSIFGLEVGDLKWFEIDDEHDLMIAEEIFKDYKIEI